MQYTNLLSTSKGMRNPFPKPSICVSLKRIYRAFDIKQITVQHKAGKLPAHRLLSATHGIAHHFAQQW